MKIENSVVNNTTSTLELQKCNDINAALKDQLSWKWDDRFGVVLAEFDVQDKEKLQSVLNQHFSVSWNQSTAKTAPENVRAAADRLGGVQAGQIFFTADLEQETLMYCAWWPWGNGRKISIRIASFPVGGKQLKSCFGL